MRNRVVFVSILASAGVLAVGWELGASAASTTIASSALLSGAPSSAPSDTPATVAPSSAETAPLAPLAPASHAPASHAPASHAPAAQVAGPQAPAPAAPAAPAPVTRPATTKPAKKAPPPANPPPASKNGTYRGQSISTPYGNVQVQITVSGNRITDVTPLALTNVGSLSAQISSQAVPLLRQEVLQSQSAHVSNISGATYTSEGYLASVQSAIDQAGL